MDQRSPTPHVQHPPFDGENLERERQWFNRPFPFTPWESFRIVAVTLTAIGYVGWEIIKMGAPV